MSRCAWWPVVAVPVLLAVALLWPAAARGESVVGWDFLSYDWPRLTQLAEAYRRLEVPGWTRFVGVGAPFASDLAVSAYYPPQLVVLACSPRAALNWLIALHLVIGYTGAWRLARSRGRTALAAHLTALAHALGGVAVGYMGIPALMAGTALLPWAVHATTWALAPGAPRRRIAIAGVPFALSFLGAAPESCLLGALVAFALVVSDGAARATWPRALGRAAGGLLAIALVAGALSAVTLVPFAVSARETSRGAGLDYEQAARRSLHPVELLGSVVPGYIPVRQASGAVPWHTTQSVGLATIALGAAALALALGANGRRRDATRALEGAMLEPAMLEGAREGEGATHEREDATTRAMSQLEGAAPRAMRELEGATPRVTREGATRVLEPRWTAGRREAALLLAAGALALLYALGRHGPLYPALWELLPPVRALRYPAKTLAATTLVLALLAGAGLDGLRAARARLAALLVAGGIGLVAAVAAGVVLASGDVARGVLLAVPAGASVAVVVALRHQLRPARQALVLLLLVELFLSARLSLVLGPGSGALYADAPPRFALALRADEQRRGAPVRVALEATIDPGPQRTHAEERIELERIHREAITPNTGACWGIASADAFSSYVPARFHALRRVIAGGGVELRVQRRAKAMTHVVTNAPTEGLEAIDALPPLVLERIPDAPPWAATYTRAHAAPDAAAALARVLEPDFSPARECVIEGLAPEREPGLALVTPARAVEVGVDRLVLDVDGPRGWLVVREGWGRGWSATVDGAPAPVLPADALFRAVPVPDGPHRVVLTYAQPGRPAGAALCVVAWLAVLGLAGAQALTRSSA